MRYSSAAVLFLISSISPSAAQLPPGLQTYTNQMVYATQNTIGLLKKEFLPVLSNEERAVFTKIAFKVDAFDWNIYGTRAYIDSASQRHVVFTLGFIMATDYMDRAWLELMLLQEDELLDYMEYVGNKIKQSVQAVQTGTAPPPIKPYCEFLGRPAQQCESMRGTPQYAQGYPLVKVSGMAVVMGHEVAHHVKGHFGQKPQQSKLKQTILAQEREADEFGVTLAIKAGYNPMYSLGDLLLFGSMVIDHPFAQSSDKHPHPLCRTLQAMEAGLKAMETDADGQAYLKQRGKANLLAETRAGFDAAKKKAPSDCLS